MNPKNEDLMSHSNFSLTPQLIEEVLNDGFSIVELEERLEMIGPEDSARCAQRC